MRAIENWKAGKLESVILKTLTIFMRTRVLYFDTSFLVHAVFYKIDFFEEIAEKVGRVRAVVPSTLLNELAAVESRGGRFAHAAAIADVLLRQRINVGEIALVKTKQSVDSFILGSATPGDVVCTNDKALRESLKKRGIKTAITRGKSILL